MKLSIIIPVFNNWNFTKSCLNDLYKLPKDHEIIIVDNGSTDETKNLQDDDSKNLKIIKNKENKFYAGACNQGFAIAKSEYICFFNNDIRVKSNHENWTRLLIDKAGEGLVGPTAGILDDNYNFIEETNRIYGNNYYISGWCLLAKKETFNKFVKEPYGGPFTEEFGIYFEDTHMGFLAKRMGIPMIIQPIPVVHFGKATSRKLNTLSLYLPAKEKFIKKWKNP